MRWRRSAEGRHHPSSAMGSGDTISPDNSLRVRGKLSPAQDSATAGCGPIGRRRSVFAVRGAISGGWQALGLIGGGAGGAIGPVLQRLRRSMRVSNSVKIT